MSSSEITSNTEANYYHKYMLAGASLYLVSSFQLFFSTSFTYISAPLDMYLYKMPQKYVIFTCAREVEVQADCRPRRSQHLQPKERRKWRQENLFYSGRVSRKLVVWLIWFTVFLTCYRLWHLCIHFLPLIWGRVVVVAD